VSLENPTHVSRVPQNKKCSSGFGEMASRGLVCGRLHARRGASMRWAGILSVFLKAIIRSLSNHATAVLLDRVSAEKSLMREFQESFDRATAHDNAGFVISYIERLSSLPDRFLKARRNVVHRIPSHRSGEHSAETREWRGPIAASGAVNRPASIKGGLLIPKFVK